MSKEKISSLMEIRDLLKEEIYKFDSINEEIIDNQNDIQKINDNYSKYNNAIKESHSHVNNLKKFEFYENLFVYIGFYFFFFCVIVVLFRRIPLRKIIFSIFEIMRKIVMMFYNDKKETVSNFDNDSL